MTWVLYAPCGCRFALLAQAIRPGIEEILDEATAWQRCYSEVHIARMRVLGFTWELEVSGSHNSSLSDCAHRGDYEPDVWVTLDGHTWASKSEHPTVEHLVPWTDVDKVEYYSFGCSGSDVAPLCSPETTAVWRWTARINPCPVCEQEAIRLARPTRRA